MKTDQNELRQRNLLFFGKNLSHIYQSLKNNNTQSQHLTINKSKDSCDLYINSQSIYNGSAQTFAQEEVSLFRQQLANNPNHGWLAPCVKGTFSDIQRPFHQTREAIYAHSAIQEKAQWSGFQIIHPLPVLVILGSGLGFHIQTMVEQKLAKQLIIYEPNIDYIISSLDVTDWEKVTRIANESQITLNWVVHTHPQQAEEDLLSQCLSLYPYFPFATHFYHHQDPQAWTNLIHKIHLKFMMKLYGVGNYDDEINQMNQSIYNTRYFPIRLMTQLTTARSLPAVIIAGGPSLDERIEQVRKMSGHAIIISAGSTLVTLHRYHIKPDIHVALESDQLATDVIKAINDQNYLKSIPLFGPIQLSPCLIESFQSFTCYFRAEGQVRALLGVSEGLEISGIPNCLNLAVLVSLLLGFKRLYLYGADLGFKELDKHHAKTSMYYDDGIHSINRAAVDFTHKDLVTTHGVDGKLIHTELLYLQAKEALEKLIRQLPHNLQCINCSDGAKIEGSTWLPFDHFENHFSSLIHIKEGIEKHQWIGLKNDDIHHALSQSKLIINRKKIIDNIDTIILDLKKVERYISEEFSQSGKEISSFFTLTEKLLEYIQQKNNVLDPITIALVQPCLWLFIYDGISHVTSLNECDVEVFISNWMKSVRSFFLNIPEHTEHILEVAVNDKNNLRAKLSIYSRIH